MRLLENFEGGGSRIFVEFLVEGWGGWGGDRGRGTGYSRGSGIAERIRASGKLSRPRLDNSTGTLVAPRFDIFPASIGIFLRDSILRVSSLFCSLSPSPSPSCFILRAILASKLNDADEIFLKVNCAISMILSSSRFFFFFTILIFRVASS